MVSLLRFSSPLAHGKQLEPGLIERGWKTVQTPGEGGASVRIPCGFLSVFICVHLWFRFPSRRSPNRGYRFPHFDSAGIGYLPGVSTSLSPLADQPALNQVAVPDLWQQQAVTALREGKDVVVQAPTGAGKTLIFELWSNRGKSRGQAIYTVPTRALANDKLAEWRARGWDVGIATGDLAENLGAPILVATLETQKNRLDPGDGPALLVVDEYQMIGDPDRG